MPMNIQNAWLVNPSRPEPEPDYYGNAKRTLKKMTMQELKQLIKDAQTVIMDRTIERFQEFDKSKDLMIKEIVREIKAKMLDNAIKGT